LGRTKTAYPEKLSRDQPAVFFVDRIVMKPIKIISASPLFHGLEEKYHEDLARIVLNRTFKRSEIIFYEGDEATGFFVIASGRVKIFKTSPEGKEQILHIFGRGEPFGEVPVFTGRCFPACAEALSDTTVLFFPRKNFIAQIKAEPALALNMLSVLSLRLKRFTALIDDLSLKEVPGRLAAYLLYLSDRNNASDELDLDISKGQLASILGTIPETLSRILSRMSKEGVIELDGKRHFMLKDRSALEQLAQGEKKLA